MPDDPTVALSKVSAKGLVQVPLEIREKLGLKPGTRMIIVATGDAVVLQKVETLLTKESPQGILRKLRSILSKVPIRDIER
ncbi:MAG: AbrB/MazE/SpoVT family DNA-binding domain-containing protein [Nitrososphaerales archaeon]|nr:AbrB/MazE/SpoVT family DNA-binding domain-containing protein [Nitrososphaerales archaeon]